MRNITLATLMVMAMAGSSVALASQFGDEQKASAKAQYSQTKDSAKSQIRDQKSNAKSQVSDQKSNAKSQGNAHKDSAKSKVSDTKSQYQKKSYADVLKNEH
ncbi:hypothetical protein [Cobetia sp. QF-1]|uniref:hypothetical protein n=1 Tax=Cobetia sp. QF-1 TaxID=1969833 RepID=UPI000B53D2ED|nr:hypothetical protein [Cobetia sp. QF-1]